jgi:hypothetical protein
MSVARERVSVWLPWIGFAAALVYVWPRSVIPRSDDFGYLESVVNAIRGEWFAGSQWLEPFNLVLPVISAALYQLTASFYTATVGLIGIVALANFVLLWRWLRPVVSLDWTGALAVLAVAIGPVSLNKTVEFTGVPLGWTFFLGALLAWRARAAGLFFCLVLLGFLNRQSIVCLLLLPCVHESWRWRRGERVEVRWIAGLVVTSAAVVAVMTGMPRNFARTLTALHGSETSVLPRLSQALLGLGLLGGLAALWALLRGERPVRVGRADLQKWGPVIAWLALGVITVLIGVELRCETPHLARLAPLVVVGAFGLSAAMPRALLGVEPAMLAAALFYGALVAWRGVWWDYYLCEAALLLAARRADVMAPVSRPVSGITAVALLLIGAVWLFPLRWQLRWAERQVVAYEPALREGRLAVSEISEAPFGYLGWKVFPAFVARGTTPDVRLSDFLKFVETGRSYVQSGDVKLFPPEAERHSLHGSGELWPLAANYRPRIFPLNDAEWRAWLKNSTTP